MRSSPRLIESCAPLVPSLPETFLALDSSNLRLFRSRCSCARESLGASTASIASSGQSRHGLFALIYRSIDARRGYRLVRFSRLKNSLRILIETGAVLQSDQETRVRFSRLSKRSPGC
jgi:hypothetical protein